MAAAMEEAVRKLRIEERAMKARAEASERLSSEIIASMTSGLLVVGDEGAVRTLNPAGRSHPRICPADAPLGHFREMLADSSAAGGRHRRVPDDAAAPSCAARCR